MKRLLTILAVTLLVALSLPALLVVGIALGPAILVMLFIAGIAVATAGVAWALGRATHA